MQARYRTRTPLLPSRATERPLIARVAGWLAVTDLVTTKLLSVKQVFGRLDPDEVGRLMAPGVDQIAEQVAP